MNNPQKFWVGFNLVKGIGPVRLRRLLTFFGSAEAAWGASPQALREAALGPDLTQRLIGLRASVDLDALWEQFTRQGIRVLTWLDDEYPSHLKEIDYPPPVLYLRGGLVETDDWAVAVVGTRRMSSYGRRVTEELVGTLSRHQITIISGLARGVDSTAHMEALRAGGRTLAILGTGVDRVYPPENRRLAAAIEEQGALISDYPPGTRPEAANFPPRNRIIAGLSSAVIIIEAGRRSGALITASFAAEQGRDVFSVPGSIYAPESRGTNYLIQQGASPLLSPVDVMESLEITLQMEKEAAQKTLPADPVERQLLAVLSDDPLHVDQIQAQAGLSAEKVIATLALMELKGFVCKQSGMRYVLGRGIRTGNSMDQE